MDVLNRQQRILRVGWISLCLAVGVLLYRLDPVNGGGLTCPFHAFTGLDCFGCGLTRSLHAALHGDVLAALGYHAVGPVILGFVAGLSLVWFVEAATGRRRALLRSANLRWGSVIGTCAVWIVYGAVRMIIEVSGTWMR